MAGIRGYGCLEPCPTCHVPHDEQHDCGKARWPFRTGVETQKTLESAQELSAGGAEELLKKKRTLSG